jgi:succinoglycan biosynthesis transport protein ExoP
MLQINNSAPHPGRERTLGTPEEEPLRAVTSLERSVKSLAALVGRQLPIFLVVIPCAMALGLLYLLTTPPSYTAIGKLLIDTRKVPAYQQQQIFGDQTIDTVAIATQVEVLTSENVSLAVIRDLKLTDDPEFVGPSAGLIGAFFHWISSTFDSGSGAMQTESQLLRRALSNFEARRKVTRVPLTYAMEISFSSVNPAKAAQIANAISDAYIVDQLEAKYQSARRASAWLQERINTLRAEASADSQAVVDFKQKNNIIESSGKLMNEQRLSEVNTQLMLARAATAEAKARFDRITQIMSKDIPDVSVGDALKSEVVIKLREHYLELAGREAIWSKKFGSDHLATISLRNQMLELRRNIADEMQKIAESSKSEYEIALKREASIRQSLDNAVAESHITNQAQVQLRDLESKAQTSRTMYDNFLHRYMEAVQEQSFPVSEARLITPATPPRVKSHPKPVIVLVLSLAGGTTIALGAAVLREASNRVFRAAAQVENALQVNCLAMLPILKPALPATAKKNQAHDVTFDEARRIKRSNDLLSYAVDEPFSQFTELLRSLKVVADLNGGVQANRVIGFTSTLPDEGKSTLAANFAAMVAHSGPRVILLDADLRKPKLSWTFAPGATAGLVEVAAGQIGLEETIWTDPESGLIFLPAGPQSAKLLHPNEILASLAIKSLIGKLRDTFDYVIVDFAPIAAVVDTRTTASFIDSYIYVIEWGQTKIDAVKHSLSNAPEVFDRLLGVVLNKAKMSVIQRYEPYRNSYYGKYSCYGGGK